MPVFSCLDYLRLGMCPECDFRTVSSSFKRTRLIMTLRHIELNHPELMAPFLEAYQKSVQTYEGGNF